MYCKISQFSELFVDSYFGLYFFECYVYYSRPQRDFLYILYRENMRVNLLFRQQLVFFSRDKWAMNHLKLTLKYNNSSSRPIPIDNYGKDGVGVGFLEVHSVLYFIVLLALVFIYHILS